jgi:2-amino-4-hydroxy-6-hydroxymethyldihydropteridine diphosphokinase
MNTAIIGLGSNINPEQNILDAIRILGELMTVLKCSEMVRTAPIGLIDQPDFINGAVKVSTGLSREELQKLLKKTEDRLGRDRNGPKYGPRTIDLDLIIWNNEIIDSDYYFRPFLQQSVKEVTD